MRQGKCASLNTGSSVRDGLVVVWGVSVDTTAVIFLQICFYESRDSLGLNSLHPKLGSSASHMGPTLNHKFCVYIHRNRAHT